MNDHNHKALYFCHTHPNLFLQKQCESCRRGMCHTCIVNHPKYCPDCLKQLRRTSTTYEDLRALYSVLIGSLIISSIIGVLLVYHYNNNVDFPLTKYLLITVFGALTVTSGFFMLRNSEFLSTVSKVPFIGFKLSLLLLILILFSGLPILYMLYKAILILKDNYFNRS
ncbi:hypothetical protein [Winogradskyella tangerina]|uniref:hypothetical protein n=1 Tax=Winogradskyella tangerina TaxID=2023240 RepID=UPI001300A5A2|nr:hypothetical protein [Winogradskyella tangerina]